MNLPIAFTKLKYECGTDEAGRGCLAGPVTAAVVILPATFDSSMLTDSKLLSKSKRDLLRPIIEVEAIGFAFEHVYPEDIDKINILNASILAMHRALDKLLCPIEFISVDGNRFKPYKQVPHETIIKGDGKYLNIAAASIIAKTYRDAYMCQIHNEFPMYNWKQNKGYPTEEHRDAIKKYGVTIYHRKSFRLFHEQLKLDL